MGFQDNSGDIILDVVLTDEGRRVLAGAAGVNFSIDKFALSDDEINYALFDLNAATALQDLTILQTPILEAFTDNAASLKYKLWHNHALGDILYLPTMLLNTLGEDRGLEDTNFNSQLYVVTATQNDHHNANSLTTGVGILNGIHRQGIINGGGNSNLKYIRLDVGFNTTNTSQIPQQFPSENRFDITMDNRLLTLKQFTGAPSGISPVIDDDQKATYEIPSGFTGNDMAMGQNTPSDVTTPILGQLTRTLKFTLGANALNLQNNYLFNKMGGSTTMKDGSNANTNIRYIDTTVTVVGRTYGASIDIPVRIVKLA